MAARTIEPAIGASTWAFGSQRCSPYSGIFTIKASKHANHKRLFVHEGGICGCVRLVSRIDMLKYFVLRYRRETRRGRDPASV